MSNYPELLSKLPHVICDTIKKTLPELKSCQPHFGEFSIKDLKNVGALSPAVFVSNMGVKIREKMSGRIDLYSVEMALGIITKDTTTKSRVVLSGHDAAANISQSLLVLISDNHWGHDQYGQAENVQAQPVRMNKAENSGIILWVITWVQPITFYVAEKTSPLAVDMYARPNGDGEFKKIDEDVL